MPPETPERPTAQAPLPIREVYSAPALNQGLAAPVDAETGTFEVKADSVVIGYETDDGPYEVVYDVAGPTY